MDYGEPISYLTLQIGVDVISADGERVGAVEHVLADEKAVLLTVAAAEVERLPKPEPNPATLEHHGAEDTESELQQKLRRAWDLISGRY